MKTRRIVRQRLCTASSRGISEWTAWCSEWREEAEAEKADSDEVHERMISGGCMVVAGE